MSADKEKQAKLAHAGADQAEQRLAVRDPYIFEFLGIKPREVIGESDLEDARRIDPGDPLAGPENVFDVAPGAEIGCGLFKIFGEVVGE